jgi:hypothetical protein
MVFTSSRRQSDGIRLKVRLRFQPGSFVVEQRVPNASELVLNRQYLSAKFGSGPTHQFILLDSLLQRSDSMSSAGGDPSQNATPLLSRRRAESVQELDGSMNGPLSAKIVLPGRVRNKPAIHDGRIRQTGMEDTLDDRRER